MKKRDMAVTFVKTEPAGRTVDIVSAAIDGSSVDIAIALGGDGTFAEVAKGILAASRDICMGMLPSGTANDQGKSFGVSAARSGLDENLTIIEEEHITQLDVGRIKRFEQGEPIDEDLFFDSAGWGLQAEILAKRNRDRQKVSKIPLVRDLYRDQAVYAGAALNRYLRSFVEPTKFEARIEADGETYHFTGLTDLIVSATAIYGGAWVLDRDTEPDDGRFELIPFVGRRDLFSKAIRDLSAIPIWQEDLDSLGLKHSQGFKASSFDIVLSRREAKNIAAQMDGEEWRAGHHYRVDVLANRLPLITPRDFVPPWKSRV
jgi:diacylglycerol kinase family enzyme